MGQGEITAATVYLWYLETGSNRERGLKWDQTDLQQSRPSAPNGSFLFQDQHGRVSFVWCNLGNPSKSKADSVTKHPETGPKHAREATRHACRHPAAAAGCWTACLVVFSSVFRASFGGPCDAVSLGYRGVTQIAPNERDAAI